MQMTESRLEHEWRVWASRWIERGLGWVGKDRIGIGGAVSCDRLRSVVVGLERVKGDHEYRRKARTW